VYSIPSNSMSERQIALLERALAIVSKLDEGGWRAIPLDLRLAFAKYMDPDIWTGLPDILTLREAALMIVRDAIARTGEFTAASDGQTTHDKAPLRVFAA